MSTGKRGMIVTASSDHWEQTINGLEYSAQFTKGISQEAVYRFKDGKPATFHSFVTLINETADTNIKEFELFSDNDSPMSNFKSLDRFKITNIKLSITPFQVFSFNAVTAKYFRFKLISIYGWMHPLLHKFQL